MQNKKTYHVRHKVMLLRLLCFMVVLNGICMVTAVILSSIPHGINPPDVRELFTLKMLAILLVANVIGILILLLPYSLVTSKKIILTDSDISATSCCGRVTNLPLEDLINIESFDSKFIIGYILKSKKNGSMFIPKQTDDVDTLIERIRRSLSKEKTKGGTL